MAHAIQAIPQGAKAAPARPSDVSESVARQQRLRLAAPPACPAPLLYATTHRAIATQPPSTLPACPVQPGQNPTAFVRDHNKPRPHATSRLQRKPPSAPPGCPAPPTQPLPHATTTRLTARRFLTARDVDPLARPVEANDWTARSPRSRRSVLHSSGRQADLLKVPGVGGAETQVRKGKPLPVCAEPYIVE